MVVGCTIYNKIKEYLDDGKCKYTYDEDNNVFLFGVSLPSAINNILVMVIVEEKSFFVKTVLPISIDVSDFKQLCEMMKFICQINYVCKNGNFEIDLCDGEIGYKCYVDCEELESVSLRIIEKNILIPVLMTKEYAAGFEEIIFNGVVAEEAYQNCEKRRIDRLVNIISAIDCIDEEN